MIIDQKLGLNFWFFCHAVSFCSIINSILFCFFSIFMFANIYIQLIRTESRVVCVFEGRELEI